MTDDEIEKMARAEYEAARQPDKAQIPWNDLPQVRRDYWRELVRHSPGAAAG